MRETFNIQITPTSVTLCGKEIPVKATGEQLLSTLYRDLNDTYPKFFKMDTLAKLGFVASELLLREERKTLQEKISDRAVILANKSASIKNDTDYMTTISDEQNYFPSPALFVYTLPNIVTGEIAIRNKYTGETSFYILDNEKELDIILETTPFTSAIAGWVEAKTKDDFIANIKILWKN